MTEEKWKQITKEENSRMNEAFRRLPVSPESWEEVRLAVSRFLSEVDKATAIYEMENKR